MTSQPARGGRNITEEELEQAANECVRLFINRSLTKVPLKRADILKFLNKIREGLAKNIAEVFNLTSKKLKEVYGFRIIDINKTHYFIIIDDEDDPGTSYDKIIKSHDQLLIPALTHIFMSGGSVREDGMWRFLEKAGLMKDSDTATQKILTQKFTKELYLNYVKSGDPDNPKYFFEWGPRANHEVPKIYLLKKVAEAFNRPADYWSEQYHEAMETEENVVE